MHHFWDFNTALHTQTRLWAIGHCFFLWSLNTKYKDFPHDLLSLSFSHCFLPCCMQIPGGAEWRGKVLIPKLARIWLQPQEEGRGELLKMASCRAHHAQQQQPMNEWKGRESRRWGEGYFLYVERDHEIRQRISSAWCIGGKNIPFFLWLCHVIQMI